ncbi:SCP-like extracellular [Sphingomonas montanisoli]|uniref:SCP-like extracellular n=1 Tax=Sphingomonas montanisoli TaxID=2606412 RepID=A0A5D9C1J4_9SPHN|nr:SCP-like extracellular [Sphingomonas montanisoli]
MTAFRSRALQTLSLIAAGGLLCAAAPATRLDNFKQRILDSHNTERTTYKLRPLVWSDALAAEAAKWAAHLSALSDLEHDESLDVEGENLWRGTKGYYTPEDMVKLWISEKKMFQNNPIPDVSVTGDFGDVGHFTQVVWHSTGLVGCAVADAKGGDEVMVCRYMEGGNVQGQHTY